ncbi:MAG: SDR family NAD(P)-dependent oxidoreductase [Chloroflexota bacterium]
MTHDLSGRHALVTGSSRGFGLAVAGALASAGADVTMCARDAAFLAHARDEVIAEAPGSRVLAIPADVTDPEHLAQVVEASVAQAGPIDVLVSSAGVYGPKGAIQEIDMAAWIEALHVNLVGSVLACRAVLPSMLREGREHRGKIILLSGGGATKPMPYLSAYAASKAAVVRFGETLAEEVRDHGIDVNAVAPGALNTRLLDEILEAGPAAVGQTFYDASVRQKETGGTPLARGADLCVFLASSASDGITGKLISAVWDPWDALPGLHRDLDGTDVYTLRRIVPADRGHSWG